MKGKVIQAKNLESRFFWGYFFWGWGVSKVQNPYPEKRSNGQYLLGRFHFPLATCGKARALLSPLHLQQLLSHFNSQVCGTDILPSEVRTFKLLWTQNSWPSWVFPVIFNSNHSNCIHKGKRSHEIPGSHSHTIPESQQTRVHELCACYVLFVVSHRMHLVSWCGKEVPHQTLPNPSVHSPQRLILDLFCFQLPTEHVPSLTKQIHTQQLSCVSSYQL